MCDVLLVRLSLFLSLSSKQMFHICYGSRVSKICFVWYFGFVYWTIYVRFRLAFWRSNICENEDMWPMQKAQEKINENKQTTCRIWMQYKNERVHSIWVHRVRERVSEFRIETVLCSNFIGKTNWTNWTNWKRIKKNGLFWIITKLNELKDSNM